MEQQDAREPGERELMPDAQSTEDAEGGAEPIFELELDGQVHTLPAALKGAFLRQADYTRKTQELAQHRRALQAEREAVATQGKSLTGAANDRAHLAALDSQLSEFASFDWRGLSQTNPQQAQALWAQVQKTQTLRDRYAYAVTHHETRREIDAAREAAEAMAQTGRVLSQEIEGWSPDIATKLVDYAKGCGVTDSELAQMADPRLWKVLHRAWKADQADRQDGATAVATRAQAVRPAVLVAGAARGAGGVRDELNTKEWMARRNAQMAKGL